MTSSIQKEEYPASRSESPSAEREIPSLLTLNSSCTVFCLTQPQSLLQIKSLHFLCICFCAYWMPVTRGHPLSVLFI